METLGAREGTDVRGAKDVRALVLSRCSHPCNSFLYKHSKLEELVDNVKFLIINYILNIAPQTRIKATNSILCSLHYSTTHQTLLKLTIVVLHRFISLF